MKPVYSFIKKSVIYVFIICASICLAGCNEQKQTTAVIQSNLDCDFTAEYADIDLSGHLILTDENATLTISQPDTLKGVTVELDNNDNLKLEYTGITVKLDINKYPESAFAKVMVATIRDCAKNPDANKDKLTFNKEENRFYGEIEKHKYTIEIDEFSRPVTLTVPDYSLTAKFKYR